VEFWRHVVCGIVPAEKRSGIRCTSWSNNLCPIFPVTRPRTVAQLQAPMWQSVTHRLARRRSSKQTFRFYTSSLHFIRRICSEFSFVYGNNQRMLCTKIHILSTYKPGWEGSVVYTTPTGQTMDQSAQSHWPVVRPIRQSSFSQTHVNFVTVK